VTTLGDETILGVTAKKGIFKFQILTKNSKSDENPKWSHIPSKSGEIKISPQRSQVTWGGELIGLVQ
jgi:hypothetical protein